MNVDSSDGVARAVLNSELRKYTININSEFRTQHRTGGPVRTYEEHPQFCGRLIDVELYFVHQVFLANAYNQ